MGKRVADMTPEQREEYNRTKRERWSNMTPEQRENRNRKQRERRANKTPEQREEYNRKQRESQRGRRTRTNTRYDRYGNAPAQEHSGYCEACGAPISGRNAHSDHDHETGRWRGWLCAACNIAEGLIRKRGLGILAYLAERKALPKGFLMASPALVVIR